MTTHTGAILDFSNFFFTHEYGKIHILLYVVLLFDGQINLISSNFPSSSVCTESASSIEAKNFLFLWYNGIEMLKRYLLSSKI